MPAKGANKCACGKTGAYRYKVTVLGSTVWCIVCAEHLEWEREMQGGRNPPSLEPLVPAGHRRLLRWRMIQSALSRHPRPLTTCEIAQATGISAHAVRRILTAHNGKGLALRRQGKLTFWELCESLEEIPY